jgi:tetratricopeptide (TPR) repeat protein
MAKTMARKTTKGGVRKKVRIAAKSPRRRPAKQVGKASARAKTLSKKAPPKKAKNKPSLKSRKPAKRAVRSKDVAGATPVRTRPPFPAPPPPPEHAPPLLRESKLTTAALGRLEKGIKALYQKDFKKARLEFKSLIDDYPAEWEILARARSYLQICAREEAAHKRPAITNDQLYGLGVMEHNRGNYEGALGYFRQALVQRPEADHIHYSIAASLAVKGDALEAIQTLRKAIELNEDNRIYAKNDSDFLTLHVHKEFTNLVGLNPAPAGDSSES